MNWNDFACRSPYLIALAFGIVICILRFGKHRLPAILAASGFGMALIYALFGRFVFGAFRELFDDRVLANRISLVLMSF